MFGSVSSILTGVNVYVTVPDKMGGKYNAKNLFIIKF